MNRLYQWLFSGARFFRSNTAGRGTGRTVRTEVTVERQSTTLLMGGGATAVGFDTCPLCGSQLAPPAQPEPPAGRLLEGSISQETGPIDHPPP